MIDWARVPAAEGDAFTLVADVSEREADMLRALVSRIRDILAARVAEHPADELAAITGIRSGPATAPTDKALARLLPDFSRGDAGLSSGLRQLREPELIEAKDGVAAVVLGSLPAGGGAVELTPEQADAWLSAVNDVRLVLGAVLDVTEDTPDVLPPTDPRAPHLPTYHWLTWVQESLLHALSPEHAES